MSEKDTQAVQQAQKAAAAKGAETEKAQQDVQQQAARSGGGDTLPPESPYQSYDFMPLSELQALADQRGVTINPDVLKAHLVTELRAHQSGATSPTSRRGVR